MHLPLEPHKESLIYLREPHLPGLMQLYGEEGVVVTYVAVTVTIVVGVEAVIVSAVMPQQEQALAYKSPLLEQAAEA